MKSKYDNFVETNKKWWEKKVKDGSLFTQPWLSLDRELVKKYAKGNLKNPKYPLNDIYPIDVLKGIKDKNVLLLAGGGGQQSVIFGLLGAKVTVVDLSEGQLKKDILSAKHYGYDVKTYQGDMCNLSMIGNNSYDLVYQAPSMGYISKVKEVYSEVYRVLKLGGLYRVDAQNPQSRFTDKSSWSGEGYLVSTPYSVKTKQRSKDKKVIEFRHGLDDIFNGLIQTGFEIRSVHEMPKEVYQNGKPVAGSWEHYLLYIPGLFTILAIKK